MGPCTRIPGENILEVEIPIYSKRLVEPRKEKYAYDPLPITLSITYFKTGMSCLCIAPKFVIMFLLQIISDRSWQIKIRTRHMEQRLAGIRPNFRVRILTQNNFSGL